MEIIEKKNLREFFFYEGTIIENPKDIKEDGLKDNVLAVYTQRAYTVDPEDLEDLAFFDPKGGDTLFLIPKDKL